MWILQFTCYWQIYTLLFVHWVRSQRSHWYLVITHVIGLFKAMSCVRVFLACIFNLVYYIILPPPRQPSGRVLASSATGSGFNPLSRTASYQRRYKYGTTSSLVWPSTLKREILALSEDLRQNKNCIPICIRLLLYHNYSNKTDSFVMVTADAPAISLFNTNSSLRTRVLLHYIISWMQA